VYRLWEAKGPATMREMVATVGPSQFVEVLPMAVPRLMLEEMPFSEEEIVSIVKAALSLLCCHNSRMLLIVVIWIIHKHNSTAMVGDGGSVLVSSGLSSQGTSGKTSIESSPSGPNGVSGDLFISSGHSDAGNSGLIILQTGLSKSGAGGSLSLQVGNGGGLSNGGDISLVAGQTSAQGRKGGNVEIVGGEGSSSHTTDGGDGGNVILMGGEAKGESAHDNGGSITVRGGTSFAGLGGSLELISGQSTESSSGDICELMMHSDSLCRSNCSNFESSLYASSVLLPQCLLAHLPETKMALVGH